MAAMRHDPISGDDPIAATGSGGAARVPEVHPVRRVRGIEGSRVLEFTGGLTRLLLVDCQKTEAVSGCGGVGNDRQRRTLGSSRLVVQTARIDATCSRQVARS